MTYVICLIMAYKVDFGKPGIDYREFPVSGDCVDCRSSRMLVNFKEGILELGLDKDLNDKLQWVDQSKCKKIVKMGPGE